MYCCLVARIFLGKNSRRVLELDEFRDTLASKYNIASKMGAETQPDGKVNH